MVVQISISPRQNIHDMAANKHILFAHAKNVSVLRALSRTQLAPDKSRPHNTRGQNIMFGSRSVTLDGKVFPWLELEIVM